MRRATMLRSLSAAILLGSFTAAGAATFAPITGTLSIKAGEKPQQSTPVVIGSASLSDNSFPAGADFASASLQTTIIGDSRFNFSGAASSITDVDPGVGSPRATALVSFQQSFTTAAPQWIQLTAKVHSPPADAGSAAVVSLAASGQAAVYSIGHTAGLEITQSGLLAAGTYTLSGLADTQAINLMPPNHDGSLAGFVLITPPADFNASGFVDAGDLATWRSGFGSTTGMFASGNADGDGDSDGADFLLWQRQLGSSAAIAPATAAIPEPASLTLATIAAFVAGLARQRRSP